MTGKTVVITGSNSGIGRATGRYFEASREKAAGGLAQDDALARALWERSEALAE